MTGRERRILDTLKKVLEFKARRGAALQGNALAQEMFVKVAESAALATALGLLQRNGTQSALGGTQGKTGEERALRAALENAVATGKRAFKAQPDIEKRFRMPQGSYTDYMTGARDVADACEDNATQMARYELPLDTAERLRALIEAFDVATQTQSGATQKRVGATKELPVCTRDGLDAVRELNPIVRNVYAGNVEVLAEWHNASHVQAAPVRTKKPVPERSAKVTTRAQRPKLRRVAPSSASLATALNNASLTLDGREVAHSVNGHHGEN